MASQKYDVWYVYNNIWINALMRSLYRRINTEKVKHMKWERKQIIIFFRLNALGGEFLPMGDGVVLHNTCIVTIYIWKHVHVKAILKINKYGKFISESLTFFSICHAIYYLKLFTKIVGFIVLVAIFLNSGMEL